MLNFNIDFEDSRNNLVVVITFKITGMNTKGVYGICDRYTIFDLKGKKKQMPNLNPAKIFTV